MDAVILALIPTVIFAVAGLILIERLRIKEGEERYQHEEYRPEQKPAGGNGNGSAGNGHAPPGLRRRPQDGPAPGPPEGG